MSSPNCLKLASADKIRLSLREFVPEDLQGAKLAIVATPHRAINRWIAKLADGRGIPVNVVDDREASRFIVPAMIDRDPVLVAISTAGASPVLARRLRERLEALIPQEDSVQRHCGCCRCANPRRRRLRDTDARRRFFEALVDGAAMRALRRWRRPRRRAHRAAIVGERIHRPARGRVKSPWWAPDPGMPELLTLKALRALQDADVILYDRLVSRDVLDMARRDAAKICVGKAAGSVGSTQEEINALLVEHAQRGQRVVRLKGGDPFIFGRGGEELQALVQARIRFSVVPGITAAAGCAAYAGIPLTHRDYAHSVSFVTGHAGKHEQEPDWRGLAAPGHTAVFYMGLARVETHRGKAHGARCGRDAARRGDRTGHAADSSASSPPR